MIERISFILCCLSGLLIGFGYWKIALGFAIPGLLLALAYDLWNANRLAKQGFKRGKIFGFYI